MSCLFSLGVDRKGALKKETAVFPFFPGGCPWEIGKYGELTHPPGAASNYYYCCSYYYYYYCELFFSPQKHWLLKSRKTPFPHQKLDLQSLIIFIFSLCHRTLKFFSSNFSFNKTHQSIRKPPMACGECSHPGIRRRSPDS